MKNENGEKIFFTHAFHDERGRRVTVCGILLNNCFEWTKKTGDIDLWRTHNIIPESKEIEYFSIGIAKCSLKDNFTKRIGRAISYGRAVKNPNCLYTFSDSRPAGKIFIEVAEKLVKTGTIADLPSLTDFIAIY